MFDIGYSELLLTAIVALLVLGPEKLPGAMRTTGLWFGRIRRSFDRIKLELEAEVGMDELRRQIHNDDIMEEARRLQRDLNDAMQTTQNTWRDAQDSVLPANTNTPVRAPAAPAASTSADSTATDTPTTNTASDTADAAPAPSAATRAEHTHAPPGADALATRAP